VRLIVLLNAENVDRRHWLIFYAFLISTVLPYLPAIVPAIFIDIIPGCIIFSPVVAMLFVIIGGTYICYMGNMQMRTGWMDVSPPNVHTAAVVLYGLAPPLAVIFKFVGEAVARFYAGEGWWVSLYRTWAERRLVLYVDRVERTVSSALNAVALFL